MESVSQPQINSSLVEENFFDNKATEAPKLPPHLAARAKAQEKKPLS